MIASATSFNAFRVTMTALLAASLATCAVTATTSESATQASAQVADGAAPAPMPDGFHW